MHTFEDFQLPFAIAKAVAQLGFKVPTPIQQKAIPVALTGRDLIGCAQTGTGKTAAFCIPIFNHFLKSQAQDESALVLVPTRELAGQIQEFWLKLTSDYRQFACVSLIGGVPMPPQVRALARKPRFIIATPGRLMDHIQRRTINVSRSTILVLDEADRMLDMGFEPQLTRIANYLPKQRQTLLFSATLPAEAERLSAKFVKNPERVTVGEVSRAAEKISQGVIMTESVRKNEVLLNEIHLWQKDSILIFARTKSRTDRVARYLTNCGVHVTRIHGGRSQGQRNSALQAFKSGEARVMVATDIASRGIDVASVGFVINYDLPRAAEDYVHRIGRTGRAGAVGNAVSFVVPEERSEWQQILKLLKKTGSEIPTEKRVALSTLPQPPPQAQKTQSQPQHQMRPQQKPQQQKSKQQGHGNGSRAPFNRRKKFKSRWGQSEKTA